MDVINQVNGTLNSGLEFVSGNRIAGTVLGLFLALYAALAAPNLPASVTSIFKNSWFRLAFMFLIAYMATKDTSVAIITSVALLVTLQTLSAQDTTKSVVAAVEQKVQANIEKFASIPAKSSDNLDGDIQDYSLSNSNSLLYSGGGLHSLPDNVTKEDEAADNFLVGSPAFTSDDRSIAADEAIFDQQIVGDTYMAVGIKNELNDQVDLDNSKVQNVPYYVEKKDRSKQEVRVVNKKKVTPKKGKKVEPFSDSMYYDVNFGQNEDEDEDGELEKEDEDEDLEEFENQEENEVEEFENQDENQDENQVEEFENQADFPSCGADPGEALDGFDTKEFALF